VTGIPYDGDDIAGYFDEYGEREWDRFESRPMDGVDLEVHRRFLRQFVAADARVLEAGAAGALFVAGVERV
jgi:hypothetical protein